MSMQDADFVELLSFVRDEERSWINILPALLHPLQFHERHLQLWVYPRNGIRSHYTTLKVCFYSLLSLPPLEQSCFPFPSTLTVVITHTVSRCSHEFWPLVLFCGIENWKFKAFLWFHLYITTIEQITITIRICPLSFLLRRGRKFKDIKCTTPLVI